MKQSIKPRTLRALQTAFRRMYRRLSNPAVSGPDKRPAKRRRIPRKRLRALGLVRRSLFFRYFAACALIILLSILFLGTIMVVSSIQYSNSQKLRLYEDNAETVAKLTASFSDWQEIPNAAYQMQSIIALFKQNIDADIFIVDSGGQTVISTRAANGRGNPAYSASPQWFFPSSVPESVLSPLLSGKKKVFSEVGTLGGVYTSQYSTVGVPIVLSDGQINGAVFVSARADSLIHFVYDMVRIFLICSMFVMLFAFVVIYFVTARLVKPLGAMSRAAQSFAKGDFTTRVPVQGNDEIGQLAASFNNMAASLTTLEDMRRSFVANVSHELKTPMTSIAGFIDGILDGTIPPEKQNHYLKIVSDEVKRLSRLVRSLLDIARIEAGETRINMARFDVTEIARRVFIGFEQSIDAKRLDIRGMDMEDPVFVRSDPDLTHQIIYNLVDNAVKFANPGGYIEVHIADGDGNKVYIGIKNSGMGIPEADLPYVFDRFYKTDKSRSLDKKGVGLGLYIAKSVLNLQGQDIWVRSVEGESCEFVFTLKKS